MVREIVISPYRSFRFFELPPGMVKFHPTNRAVEPFLYWYRSGCVGLKEPAAGCALCSPERTPLVTASDRESVKTR